MTNGGINMCMRKLKIGLDCDDVLYKCNSYVIQLENLKRTAEKREMLDFDSLTSYEAAGNELDIRFEYFKSREFYESQPIIEGAQAFVSELVGMGHDVFILTSIDSRYGDIRRQRISEDLPDVKITPKSFADAVTSTVAGAGDVDPAAFADFREVLEQFAAALEDLDR